MLQGVSSARAAGVPCRAMRARSLSLALFATCACSEPARRPDVVLVVVDTLRADALGIYGAEPEPAPFLASLAADGTVFENAFAASTWTAPATASLLTGLYPREHGVIRGFFAQVMEQDGAAPSELELARLPADVPTLAERFAAAGYRTVGLASNVNIGPEMGFERGFESFERHDGLGARKLLERLSDLDVRLGGAEPTFLYLHLNDPHWPYQRRPRYYVEPGELPADETAAEVVRRRALYASEIGLVDDALREALLARGLGPSTLFVLVADHGEEFQEHGRWFHLFSLYGELARVPFFFHAPALGVRAQRVAASTSGVDLAPTLAEMCGLPPVGEESGRSLAPLLGEPWMRPGDLAAELDARPIFAHRFEPGAGEELWSVIRGSWKLIEGPEELELYDLAADPGERRNLAAAEPARLAELSALLAAHRAGATRAGGERAHVELDEALLRRLETLGYVK